MLLPSFHVTEWLPASPGRYFTERARRERDNAEQYWTGGEYLPLGKLGMILGGIGSVRLASNRTKHGVLHFLGATSSGDSSQGIPLCVTSDMYGQVVGAIREYGGMQCHVAGTIQVLDRSIDRLSFDAGIPRYAILVDDIRVTNPSRRGTVQAAVSVLYGGACREYERDYRTNNALGWSFAYFNPATDSASGLSKAVEWIEDYVRRYSVSEGPRIVGDFDEHMEHFQLPVAMRLSSLRKGNGDIEGLAALTTQYSIPFDVDQVRQEQQRLRTELRREAPSYDVALSFAGEDRAHARAIAELLRAAGVKVFFDEYEQATLWGMNLYTHLSEIYTNKATFCLMFISTNYAAKLWTKREREAAQARAFRENREYILPLRLDDTVIPGLDETVGYIDLRTVSDNEVARLVQTKISSFRN
jgi:hypothetical protein